MSVNTNPEHNRIPDHVRTVHLIAACGTGMAALACMLKDLGYDVTGSDQNVYPPMSTYLADKGIDIFKGFNAGNLAYRPDLVVVGNAVSKGNPEAMEMDRLGLDFCSMPQAFNAFVVREKQPVVIAGTHGKTTTSSLVAWLLHAGGIDVSFIIGGILTNFGSNYRLGSGDVIVIEGDEYDTAYFDKGPKFMHYRPAVSILTSVEFDHADIFQDMRHVERVFAGFVRNLDPQSTLVACLDDPNVAGLVSGAECGVVGYGNGDGAVWRMENVRTEPPWSMFDVLKSGRHYERFRTRMMGRHNLSNALAAVAVADRLSLPGSAVREALESFAGVRRRQEVRGVRNGITVVDDFAHHPTAVRETIQAVKPFFNGRLIAVFEPRTNTSMRDVFQGVYPGVFEGADLVCIREPALLHKIPDGRRFSSAKLVEDLRSRGQDAHYFQDTEAIIGFLTDRARSGDVILIMSNGGFDNIHERLLASL